MQDDKLSIYRTLHLLLVGVLALLYVLPQVFALGVTPARVTVPFQAGETLCSTFVLINNEHRPHHVLLSLGGDLAPFAKLESSQIDFNADEERRPVEICVSLPDKLSVGEHAVTITAVSYTSPHEGTTSVAAQLAVMTEFRVVVAVDGAYVESEVFTNQHSDGSAEFGLLLHNKGSELAHAAWVVLDILDERERLLTTLISDSFPIVAGSSQSTALRWDDALPGTYTVRATTHFDDMTTLTEHSFTVSEQAYDVAITDVRATSFTLGGVSEFVATIVNDEPVDMSGMNVELLIKNQEGTILSSGTSQRLTLAADSSTMATVYVDTASVQSGEYTTHLVLSRGSVVYAERTFSAQLEDDQISFTPLTGFATLPVSSWLSQRTVLVGGIVLLILVNVVWFFRRRARKLPREYAGIPPPQ